MGQEKNTIIEFKGTQISMFSDDRSDYVNLTDMATACKNRKSIKSWLKNKQTLDFLNIWEKKHNADYDGTQMGTVQKLARDSNTSLSIKNWIDLTNAIGVFTRTGAYSGTYAHKDIAIKFAYWLNPELELFLIEKIQELKTIEEQKNSYELLNHEQILFLVRLKEVFKYVAHQELIEEAHKDVFAAKSGAKNPFIEFNAWRNKILDISVPIINERIKQYCINNKIALTKKILGKTRREKILMLDSYEAVKIATWDFLQLKGEVNALNLANLVGEMMKAEQGLIYRKNETDLFHEKQDLGQYNDFEQKLSDMKVIKTAREVLAAREGDKKQLGQLSTFNKGLKKALDYKPKKGE